MDKGQCQICYISSAQYVCPKCNILYCSLACYKAQTHLQCSESFYEECVKQELSTLQGSSNQESYQRIVDILKRVQNEETENDEELDSDDEEAATDLSERLAGVDLNETETVWKQLTKEERDEFNKVLSSGHITHLLPDWEPWWTYSVPKILQEGQKVRDYKMECPKLLGTIPKLTTITKSIPSPTVPFNLLDVILSYVHVQLWLKGASFDMVIEASSTIYNLSTALSSNIVSNNITEVLINFQKKIITFPDVAEPHCSFQAVISAAKFVVDGPCIQDRGYYVIAALSDMHALFTKAKQEISSLVINKTFVKDIITKKQMSLTIKKLEYLLAWFTSDSANQWGKIRNDFKILKVIGS